ncbi:adenylate/guanylate cyclase domain-containing response regulator [Maribacter polysaccharolyticus]|uniref:adenylate/guanylate cyclase domain-containing response regulator n=1 Tax=Maribacter polysaccharolyticus TaxID=3020831 RepID=UPI00237F0419|nr:adenylate/guanylate cyclase domain-containing response regulator [Maribacter polysaccharolyticus]MDE3740424.1 adenylate/guanylate cyclase domain-containing protein [Maribacter polysaccharolyticus]
MAKILVVDDEADLETLIKQKFRKKIREKEYEFLFAINGRDALEKLDEDPEVDIVLSDINMPEMDGLTLLTKLNELSPLIKSVIVSAYGDMDNIRTAMNRGAFDFITKPINFEDLTLTMEKTLKHAREIKETLQAIKENNILKMYVDENVLNFMCNREYESKIMANESIEGTVMFVDVCGFTKISETTSPDVVVTMLNTYFDAMVKEIMEHNGIIDKFIGDAVMAVFRGEYHLDRAIDAALAIRNQVNGFPNIADKENFKPKVSIGIKSGEMISGNIGSATLKRLDYTVIGDTVNTAARLQDAAKENQIIICENCYEKVKEAFKCENLGSITMKNKTKPLTVYNVLE